MELTNMNLVDTEVYSNLTTEQTDALFNVGAQVIGAAIASKQPKTEMQVMQKQMCGAKPAGILGINKGKKTKWEACAKKVQDDEDRRILALESARNNKPIEKGMSKATKITLGVVGGVVVLGVIAFVIVKSKK